MKKLKLRMSEAFSEIGVSFLETSSGELLLEKCYNCGRAKKLYVHDESGAFICFRCNEKGGPVKLLAKTANISFKEAFLILFGSSLPEKLDDEIGDDDLEIMISGIIKRSQNNTKPLPTEIQRPYFMSDLTEKDLEPVNYLKSRGINEKTLASLGLWHWKSAKRFVFPVIVEGKLFGYLARDYTNKQSPKVLNSKGNFRSFSVWNHDNVKGSDVLVICEGSISAIKCGITRAIALLGKVATSGQIDLIKKLNPKKIVFCLDIGTDAEQYKLFQQLCIYFPGRIYNVILPKTKLVICSCGEKLRVNDGIESLFCSCGIKIKKEVINKSEYLDAGDYTEVEMDELIKEAKPFVGGPFSWAD